MHIHSNAIRTLIEHISHILDENTYDFEVVLKAKDFSDDEIIAWYCEIFQTKIVPQYTIQLLILAYLEHKFDFKSEKYRKLSRYFRIDFDKDIDQKLFERAQKEELDLIMYGYYALNLYLKNVLFANLYDNRISNLDPHLEMPMTKAIIHFIHKHYPKEIHEKLENDAEFRASKIMEFVLDLVEVIYMDEPVKY